MMGQTPWALLNELTERNLDAWKNMQRGFMDAATQTVTPPGAASRGTTTKKP
jgi:hypothetical protein